MKKYRLIGLAILAVCLFAGSAYSGTNIYKDTYTTEDSAGTWTFTNHNSRGLKTDVILIDESADTPSAVTAARTGYTYLFKPAGEAVGVVGYVLTLPSTSNGLTYTFVSATQTQLSIKPYSAHSKIKFLSLDSGDAIQTPGTTCSLTLMSYGSEWIITQMGPDTKTTLCVNGKWSDNGVV